MFNLNILGIASCTILIGVYSVSVRGDPQGKPKTA